MRTQACKRAKYNATYAATRTTFQAFALDTTRGHVDSTKAVSSSSFTKHMRDLGLPADMLEEEFKKDISFALRRVTIATTALDAAQRAAEMSSP